LEAKPGKEAAVEALLKGGLPIVAEEPETIAWFAIRLGIPPLASSTPSRANPDVRRNSLAG
jgi:hypothetical protein